ncbi:MAG: HEAT repeat domain-containing protein, partial [Vicinamibacterales bacterium]
MLEFLKRGQAARDVRLMAAQGLAQVPASELLAILVLLTTDEDEEVRRTATDTLDHLPREAVRNFLSSSQAPADVRAYFARSPQPAAQLVPAAAETEAEGAEGVDLEA